MRRTVPILLVLLLLAWAAPVTLAQSSVVSVLMGNRMLPGEYEDQVTALFSQHRWAKGKELLDQALELYPDQPNLQYLCGRKTAIEGNLLIGSLADMSFDIIRFSD